MKFARTLILALAAAVMAVVATTSAAIAPASAGTYRVPTTPSQTQAFSGADFESDVMVTINQARKHAGLKPVRFFDSCVERMASSWGSRIARSGNLVHRDQHKVLRRCDQNWAGETLIRSESALDADTIVQAWLDSPAHRAVLLKKRARVAGVSVVMDRQGRQVGVLNLADARR